jgi:hypothetical protein
MLHTQAKCDLMLCRAKRGMRLVLCVTANLFLHATLNLRYSFHCFDKTLPWLPPATYSLLNYPDNIGYKFDDYGRN